MDVRSFAPSAIVLDPACQPRATIHHETIEEYVSAILDGAEFPPLDVVLVAGVPYVVDGFHRGTAFRSAKTESVRCRVVGEGTIRDAILASCGANGTHGVRRTNADKRHDVTRLLSDPEWSSWSDREIARKCNVSHDFVSRTRRDDVSLNDTSTGKRKDSAGRLQPATKPKRSPDVAVRVEPAIDDDDFGPAEIVHVQIPAVPQVRPIEPDPMPDAPKRAEVDEYADHIRLVASRMRLAFRGTHLAHNGAFDALSRAESLLRSGAPVDCPTCSGSGGSCKSCAGHGWVTRGDAKAIERGMS